ncbi:MAG: nucleoside deaminase [Acidobacteriota bacterium]
MSSETYPSLRIALPAWVDEVVGGRRFFETVEERMALAISLSRRSIMEGGGPFAACVFELESGELIAPGVNQVVAARCSAAHAEIVALSIAQQVVGSFDLAAGAAARQLVTTTEPCAQCLGAIPWSGVRSVVCGARGEDAEAIGFDEGLKPEPWSEALESRGIEVRVDVERRAARQVLIDYAAGGGAIYNAGA